MPTADTCRRRRNERQNDAPYPHCLRRRAGSLWLADGCDGRRAKGRPHGPVRRDVPVVRVE
nr:MAG TPA: hypothetical protein [Caudoviricetes sp.]